MNGANPAWIRTCLPPSIHLLLQQARDPAIRAGVGSRTSRRWHRAGAQLGNDLFDKLGICREFCGIQRLEIDTCRVRFLAVARDAVLVENSPWRRRFLSRAVDRTQDYGKNANGKDSK